MARIGRIAETVLVLVGGMGVAAGNTEAVLDNFAAPPGGYDLTSGVIAGPDGELYGTTVRGGPGNGGVFSESMREEKRFSIVSRAGPMGKPPLPA